MDWPNLPLELFSSITIYCEVLEVVRLERVCKSWQENLQNQQIWKDVVTKGLPGYNLGTEVVNWRDIALKSRFVMHNMKEKRCVTRTIANVDDSGYYNQTTHNCSIYGEEALITWIEYLMGSSYSSTNFIGHELVNLRTGERSEIKLKMHNSILSKDHIISSDSNLDFGDTHCSTKFAILDRNTGDSRQFTSLNGISKAYAKSRIINAYNIEKFERRGTMYQNEDPKFGTIAIVSGLDAYILELKTGKVLCSMKLKNFENQYIQSVQFYGKYLAYSIESCVVSSKALYIVVMDVETKQQVFNERIVTENWCIADNKILLASNVLNGVKWQLKKFDGTIVSEYNAKEKRPEPIYRRTSVRILGNIIAFMQQTQVHFFNALDGNILCSVALPGVPEYAYSTRLLQAGEGKFVVSQKNSTRILDFESPSLLKEIKVAVVSPDSSKATNWSDPIRFSNLMDFAAVVIGQPDLAHYASIPVHRNDDDTSRISMIFVALRHPYSSAKRTDPENPKATTLFWNCKQTMASAINMLPLRFVEPGSVLKESPTEHRSWIKKKDKVYGTVVLYKEEWIRGEWVPVDIEPNDCQ